MRVELVALHRDLAVLEPGLAAQDVQELERRADVGQLRHVGQLDLALGQDAGHEDGQGRVLGAANADGSVEGFAAPDDQLVHVFL